MINNDCYTLVNCRLLLQGKSNNYNNNYHIRVTMEEMIREDYGKDICTQSLTLKEFENFDANI